MSQKSLQDTFAPHNHCFGCGPANLQGLQLKSFARGDDLVATWTPQPFHQAFEGVLNGGVIGALLDCHCNWAAACHFMQATQADRPPCTVTAEYTIQLKHPTPTTGPLDLRAWVIEAGHRRAIVAGELSHNGQVTATCRGTFVAVKPGHPAFHRW